MRLVKKCLYGFMLLSVMAVAFTVTTLPAIGASKHISAEDFGDSWPFTVSEGMLSCTRGSIVTFTAYGTQYAVNGTAKSRGYANIEPIWKLNWEIHEAVAEAFNITIEEAIEQSGPIRISIGPIIDAGLKLC